ncbi:MAG TPA: glycogen-binding domain-containing protein [Candidatus Limnocylindrales bacterium]|nr:glycogen-binding domain-containing protein [Candidatus Limnocylindrales bacterium]
MLKKAAKKTVRSANPKSTQNRSQTSYPVDEQELHQQKARIRRAATAGKAALKKPGSMRVEFPSQATKLTQKLLPVHASSESPKQRRPFRSKPILEVNVVNVSFALVRPGARQVSLCGEFNAWSPEAGPMTPHDDGHWEAIVALRPGRYQYKFLVDGEWVPDPLVQETVPNEFGSFNSVIEVVVY